MLFMEKGIIKRIKSRNLSFWIKKKEEEESGN
jgi:hypothetical protein